MDEFQFAAARIMMAADKRLGRMQFAGILGLIFTTFQLDVALLLTILLNRLVATLSISSQLINTANYSIESTNSPCIR